MRAGCSTVMLSFQEALARGLQVRFEPPVSQDVSQHLGIGLSRLNVLWFKYNQSVSLLGTHTP